MIEVPIFVDIDTQVDFMLPEGKLYVPQAVEIIPNLRRLMSWACEQGILVLSSADAHPPDDPSFEQWPPHCVVGTEGQRRIPETQLPAPWVIPNQPGQFAHLPQPLPQQIIVEKQDYDVTTNVNFEALLRSLGRRSYVVFGVATEYCVRAACLGLRKRGQTVSVVSDAIQPMTPEGGQKACGEMAAAGVAFRTTDEVLAATSVATPTR